MPQQHNHGRHVQSLTLPQSRHNHRNTSAYIFPTVPTPRTTPPTPGTASPRRRAPTLQLPVATLPCHSRHSPAAEHRPHTVPTPRPPADTGPRLAAGHCPASPPGRSNSPSQRSRSIQDTPLPPHNGPTPSQPSDHPADTGTRPAPGTKKSGSASRTYSFVSNFSVKNRRLHLAQTNALTQHNQSGAYPLINPCPHN